MAPRFVAAMLAGILILAAAVAARQQRGGRGSSAAPQTILSVVVEVDQTTVKILSATAVRGFIRRNDEQALSRLPHQGTQALVEYKATSKTAPAGTAPFTSFFHVSFVPIIERPEAGMPSGSPFKPSRPVTIAIAMPDMPADTVVSFSRVAPVPGTPSDTWQRTPMGQVALPPVLR